MASSRRPADEFREKTEDRGFLRDCDPIMAGKIYRLSVRRKKRPPKRPILEPGDFIIPGRKTLTSKDQAAGNNKDKEKLNNPLTKA
ncbi:MAG: hypothetical protein LBP22_01010 [Deltaproteobacteria bacterium]|jgi:hypothetical protein|nr:hypothetical protein [Deltaproteobacteria bacterium]